MKDKNNGSSSQLLGFVALVSLFFSGLHLPAGFS